MAMKKALLASCSNEVIALNTTTSIGRYLSVGSKELCSFIPYWPTTSVIHNIAIERDYPVSVTKDLWSEIAQHVCCQSIIAQHTRKEYRLEIQRQMDANSSFILSVVSTVLC